MLTISRRWVRYAYVQWADAEWDMLTMSRRWLRYAYNEPTLSEICLKWADAEWDMLTMSRRWLRLCLTTSRRWVTTVLSTYGEPTRNETQLKMRQRWASLLYAYICWAKLGETLLMMNQRWVRLFLQWTGPEWDKIYVEQTLIETPLKMSKRWVRLQYCMLLSYDESTLSGTLLMMNQHGDGLAAVNRCRGRLCLWWANAEWDSYYDDPKLKTQRKMGNSNKFYTWIQLSLIEIEKTRMLMIACHMNDKCLKVSYMSMSWREFPLVYGE